MVDRWMDGWMGVWTNKWLDVISLYLIVSAVHTSTWTLMVSTGRRWEDFSGSGGVSTVMILNTMKITAAFCFQIYLSSEEKRHQWCHWQTTEKTQKIQQSASVRTRTKNLCSGNKSWIQTFILHCSTTTIFIIVILTIGPCFLTFIIPPLWSWSQWSFHCWGHWFEPKLFITTWWRNSSWPSSTVCVSQTGQSPWLCDYLWATDEHSVQMAKEDGDADQMVPSVHVNVTSWKWDSVSMVISVEQVFSVRIKADGFSGLIGQQRSCAWQVRRTRAEIETIIHHLERCNGSASTAAVKLPLPLNYHCSG